MLEIISAIALLCQTPTYGTPITAELKDCQKKLLECVEKTATTSKLLEGIEGKQALWACAKSR